MKAEKSPRPALVNSARSAHPKSSRPTGAGSRKRSSFYQRYHNQINFGVFYFGCLVVSILIFYYRFPNNFSAPNFYAEDGYIFGDTIIKNGFWQALLTTFNGYYIWGVYMLEQI